MWQNNLNQNVIKRWNPIFQVPPTPILWEKSFISMAAWCPKLQKLQHLDYLNLSFYILVPTIEGQTSSRVTPIDQDGYQYTLLLFSVILNIIRLMVIVNNTLTILPLRFCWGWTTWKSEGQTKRVRVSLHLGRGEK